MLTSYHDGKIEKAPDTMKIRMHAISMHRKIAKLCALPRWWVDMQSSADFFRWWKGVSWSAYMKSAAWIRTVQSNIHIWWFLEEIQSKTKPIYSFAFSVVVGKLLIFIYMGDSGREWMASVEKKKISRISTVKESQQFHQKNNNNNLNSERCKFCICCSHNSTLEINNWH